MALQDAGSVLQVERAVFDSRHFFVLHGVLYIGEITSQTAQRSKDNLAVKCITTSYRPSLSANGH
jgi:hypothetical protein